MNVDKILRTGYFDRLKITGRLKSVYKDTGTILYPEKSFKYALDKSVYSFTHGVSNLTINLIGECDNSDDWVEMQLARGRCGIGKFADSSNKGTEGKDTYAVGFADILILKSHYALPCDISEKGQTEADIKLLAGTTEEIETLKAALELRNFIEKSTGYAGESVSIAIVDKVYTEPVFRRCGVSTWLHENIADIINMYGMVFPNGLILRYGDWANEAMTEFGLTQEEYSKMLLQHYGKLGYNPIEELNLQELDRGSNILYKLFV